MSVIITEKSVRVWDNMQDYKHTCDVMNLISQCQIMAQASLVNADSVMQDLREYMLILCVATILFSLFANLKLSLQATKLALTT